MVPTQTMVSVITPVYNGALVLEECVQSVQRQTYSSWEMILVDDQSTDASWEIAQSLARSDDRVRAIRLDTNSGAGVARNRAIQEARGRYIAFLDCDDLWRPDKLRIQIEAMELHGWSLCFSDYNKLEAAGKKERPIVAPAVVTYEALLRTCSIGCLTAIYDSFILGKRFMPHIRRRQDWALWLSILKDGHLAHNVGLVLADYRVGANGISANKLSVARDSWRFYRETVGLSKLATFWHFSNYAIYGLIKYLR